MKQSFVSSMNCAYRRMNYPVNMICLLGIFSYIVRSAE